MRYANKRVYTWSHDIAYAVGLMASDGCLSGDGRHLDLTSVDLDQLENFSKAIGRPLTVSSKNSGQGRIGYRIQFSDVALYDFLLDVGLTPRKSHTLSRVYVPDQYYGDFLRGLFDGDGSCNGYTDPRWPNSFMFYIKFCAANKMFLEFLATTNYRLFGTSIKFVNRMSTIYSLVYAKADSRILYNYLYPEDRAVLALSRKRLKLEGFISRGSVVE